MAQPILFVGLPNSGKSTILSQIINNFSNCNANKYINYQYVLKSFIVNEHTDHKIINKSCKNYHYLDLIYEFAYKGQYDIYCTKKYFRKIMNKYNTKNPNNIHTSLSEIQYKLDLLATGYIRHLETKYHSINYNNTYCTPTHIIKLIASFCAKQVINSYKLQLTKEHFGMQEFWSISGDDYQRWTQLYHYIDSLVYVFDISTYNEYDNDGCNKFVKAFNLFSAIVNNPILSMSVPKIILLNKVDIFKNKIVNKNISLKSCPMFVNYPGLNGYQISIEAIEKMIKSKADNANKEHIFIHSTVGIDKCNIKQVFTDIKLQSDCHYIDRYGFPERVGIHKP
eukprot:515848_1